MCDFLKGKIVARAFKLVYRMVTYTHKKYLLIAVLGFTASAYLVWKLLNPADITFVNVNISQNDEKEHHEKSDRGQNDNKRRYNRKSDDQESHKRQRIDQESHNRQSDKIQSKRISNVRHFCIHENLVKLNKEQNLSTKMIYAEKYRLAYIHIPKIGSTFLKKLFYVLKFGIKNAHKIFYRMRSEVHALTGELISHVNSSDLNHTTTLITVRNPYTRLFSAYVDKVYLPFSEGLRKAILAEKHITMLNKEEENSSFKSLTIGNKVLTAHKQQEFVCTTNISFQEFLNFVLTGPLRGKAMYDHYAPVSLLMSRSICSLKHLLIIKQETFVTDIEYVLRLIKVNDNIYRLFYDHLHTDYAKHTVSSIVEATYRQIRMQTDISKSSHCWTMPVIAERLWKSFQAQGIIDEKSRFPAHRFSEKAYHDSGYLVKTILNEIKTRPLSVEQREEQRKRTLLAAYKGISNKTFKRIQDMYSTDFKMFDYNTNFDFNIL